MAKQEQKPEARPEVKPKGIEYVPASKRIVRLARTYAEKWGIDARLMLAWSMLATQHGDNSEGSNHFNIKHGSPPDYVRFTTDGRNVFSVASDSWDMAGMLAKKSGNPLEYVSKATGQTQQTISKLIESIDMEA